MPRDEISYAGEPLTQTSVTHYRIAWTRVLGVWTRVFGVWACVLDAWAFVLGIGACSYFGCLSLYSGCLERMLSDRVGVYFIPWT